MSATNATYIPRPEKFSGNENITTWFIQFELFLQLSKVIDDDKGNILLTYLELPIFQAVISGTINDHRTYNDVKKFLIGRYGTTDNYLNRIGFFEKKYYNPTESYAAELNAGIPRVI